MGELGRGLHPGAGQGSQPPVSAHETRRLPPVLLSVRETELRDG